MLKKVKYKSDYGEDIDLFDAGFGAIWWSAKDICNKLKIKNAEKAIAEIDPEDKIEIPVLSNENETTDSKVKKLPRKATIINYSAIFSLLLRSQFPIAKKFQRWVVEDVLFEILVGEGSARNIDFSIIEELEEMGLLPAGIYLTDGVLEEKLRERHLEVLDPINATIGKPMVVFDFIFPGGQKGTLEGYNRGLGPIGDLKDWEEPVGIYTDTGDYYWFVFDNRESRMEKKPTFRIGDRNYYYRISSCHKVAAKVDPKTGTMIV
jgi:hypothetical protein